MAEALVNHDLKRKWQAFSAGVNPSEINPLAVKVLAEIGIDISKNRSKSVEDFLDSNDLDLVITLCDNARETCPVFLKPVKTVYISFEDPAQWKDQPEDIALPHFRRIRDEIREKIVKYLKDYSIE
jgi:arsenate reductase